MSLSSTNYISATTKISNLIWIIEKLGYKEVRLEKELKNTYQKCYIWTPEKQDLTYVGIELYISKIVNDKIEVETRTRAGRSHLEIKQQNLTIKMIRSFFGGYFESDYGKNRYFNINEGSEETTPIAMSLYIQRWKLHNALLPIKIYSDYINKTLEKSSSDSILYSNKLDNLPELNSLKPYVVSNNIQLPYIIGAWENYVKNCFLSIFKYASRIDNKLLKTDNLSNDDLLQIKNENLTIEECIVNKFSFQRPRNIISNFQKLDKTLALEVNTIFRKPYCRKRICLFDDIDNIITLRNQIVHDGFIDSTITDYDVNNFYLNIIEASNRLYNLFGKKYKFKPNYNF